MIEKEEEEEEKKKGERRVSSKGEEVEKRASVTFHFCGNHFPILGDFRRRRRRANQIYPQSKYVLNYHFPSPTRSIS